MAQNSDVDGAQIVWDFLETHWDQVTQVVHSSHKMLAIVTSMSVAAGCLAVVSFPNHTGSATNLHGAAKLKVLPFLVSHGWTAGETRAVDKALQEKAADTHTYHTRHN